MKTDPSSIRARRAALAALCVAMLGGCGSLAQRLPWAKPPPAVPQAVTELRLEPAPGNMAVATVGGIEQYWQRNTLVLDLYNVAHSGAVVLRPGEGRGWPVRLGFRAMPGRFAVLEVRGEQRVRFQIPAEGTTPLELRLEPGVYSPRTERLEVSWGPAS